MPHEKIKKALVKLQSELSRPQAEEEHDALCENDSSTNEDPELTELLANVASEISSYLEDTESASPNKHGFAHRLEEIATDLTVEHPKLNTLLLEIRKILLSIGA